jgi:2-polyprenyl-6-hydroxyphenyl methylase/3-demethylubiquinone-9 3-methyltransferase
MIEQQIESARPSSQFDESIRFEFGANWSKFIELVDERRIAIATESLKSMLQVEDLEGKSFLDIGCGSGLFSLAARRLGARVLSFDFDARSCWCTEQLKNRFAKGENQKWQVARGSILDSTFLDSIGKWDIVYSWGVLHHTGQMWTAIDNASRLVAPAGHLFIALYNDQGWKSRFWGFVKETFNRLPRPIALVAAVCLIVAPLEIRLLALSLVRGTIREHLRTLTHYSDTSQRGMSWWRDQIDWLGGYPFEVASPHAVVESLSQRGFSLSKSRLTRSLGCNEFVFSRIK